MSLIKSLINKYGGARDERYFTAIGELEKVTGAITNGGIGEYYEELNKSKNFVGLNEVVKEYFKETEFCQQQKVILIYMQDHCYGNYIELLSIQAVGIVIDFL